MTVKCDAKAGLAALGCLAVLAGAALAADDEKFGRYTMQPTEGGFIKLDTLTGVSSFCTKQADAWSCAAMPDGQQAMRDQIETLESEKKKLQEDVRRLEDAFGLSEPGASTTPDKPDEPPAPKAEIPKAEDVDKMFDYLESMVKKFKERIERLQKESGKETTPL